MKSVKKYNAIGCWSHMVFRGGSLFKETVSTLIALRQLTLNKVWAIVNSSGKYYRKNKFYFWKLYFTG